MTFWIVTPSYNQLSWLKLCLASVRDQLRPNIAVHHHVQDASSTDGTPEYLAEFSRQPAIAGYGFSFTSEPDRGMYDAINRGWLLAPAGVDVIAHLNCDEQYLPEALKKVAEAFSRHPKADILLADMVVVDKDGGYICHRRSLRPHVWTSRFCCAGFTATTFQRATVVQGKKVLFDTSWRNLGDKVWYNALHKAGCRFAVFNEMVSVFVDTGANLNWTEQGLREKQRYERKFLYGSATAVRLVSRMLGVRRILKEIGADFDYDMGSGWRLFAGGGYQFDISKGDISAESLNIGENELAGAFIRGGVSRSF